MVLSDVGAHYYLYFRTTASDSLSSCILFYFVKCSSPAKCLTGSMDAILSEYSRLLTKKRSQLGPRA